MTIDALFQNLYNGLNRDPEPVPALAVAFAPLVYPDGVARTPSSYWITVKDDHLYGVNQLPQVTGQGTGPVDPDGFSGPHPNLDLDLSTGTLADLAQALAAYPGFLVTLVAGIDPTIAAHALVEGSQDLVAHSQIAVFSSALWTVMKPMAAGLARFLGEMQQGLQQVAPAQATGFWLSSLGDLYGLDRLSSESDQAYATRILYHVLAPRANNVAMAQYLQYAFGLSTVAVIDDTPAQHSGVGLDQYAPFRFFVELDPGPAGGLPVSVVDITSVVEQIKAWGTIWQLVLKLVAQEQFPVVVEVTETNNALKLAPTAETTGFAPFDTLQAAIVQRFSDSLRPEMFPLTFEVWKNDAHEVVSDTQDLSVVFWGDGGGWRSWVESIQDIWNSPITPNFAPFADPASLVAQASEFYALTLAVEEALGISSSTTEAVQTALTQPLFQVVPRRAKAFTFEERTSMFADENALIAPAAPRVAGGADWTTADDWVAGIRDPSWYIRV